MVHLHHSDKLRLTCLRQDASPQATETGHTACLWQCGRFGNLTALAQSAHLPPDQPIADLLAALYALRGPALASDLTGDGAWILWDSREQVLMAARDRVGVQSLYYVARGGTLWISDKLEDLLSALGGPPRPNLRAVVSYLGLSVPPPGETFYEEIRAVPPGHFLLARAGKVTLHPYWRLEPQPPLRLRSDAEYAAAYIAVMCQVMREYRPTGKAAVTLSSGMDSTSVAAFLRAVDPDGDVIALTWSSPEIPAADESSYAQEVADRLAIPLLTVRADLAWTLRDPQGIRTGPAAPFYLYYTELWRDALELARSIGVQTIFTGVCGDDLFGANVFGYADMLLTGHWREGARQFCYHLARSPAFKRWPPAVRAMVVVPLLQSYAPGILARRVRPPRWLRSEHHALWRTLREPQFHTWRMLPARQSRLRMLDDRMIPPTVAENARLGAEYGIEFSHPLLDHRLLEFAASLPIDQAIRNGQRKIIVRNALRGSLPASVVNMWDKILPTEISQRGLFEREQAKVWGYLTNTRAAELGYVDEAVVQDMYRAYLAGARNDDRFWYVLTLEDWLRRYF